MEWTAITQTTLQTYNVKEVNDGFKSKKWIWDCVNI